MMRRAHASVAGLPPWPRGFSYQIRFPAELLVSGTTMSGAPSRLMSAGAHCVVYSTAALAMSWATHVPVSAPPGEWYHVSVERPTNPSPTPSPSMSAPPLRSPVRLASTVPWVNPSAARAGPAGASRAAATIASAPTIASARRQFAMIPPRPRPSPLSGEILGRSSDPNTMVMERSGEAPWVPVGGAGGGWWLCGRTLTGRRLAVRLRRCRMELTETQLGDYARDGSLFLPGLFTTAEAAVLRAEADNLYA